MCIVTTCLPLLAQVGRGYALMVDIVTYINHEQSNTTAAQYSRNMVSCNILTILEI